MRRRAALAAAALAVSFLAAAAGPVLANAPQGSFSSPGDNAVIADRTPTVAGQFTQTSNAVGSGTVNDVTVTVESVAHPDVTFQRRFTGSTGNQTLRFSWTLPELVWNGPYRATAVGRGTDPGVDPNGPELSTITRDFSLRVPPAVPGGVNTSVDRGAVTVTWRANSEPDLIGYQVQRSPKGANDWRNVGGATRNTSITDAGVPEPGEWSYRVIAARRGTNDSDVVMSDPSAAASATVAQPAPPTTAAPAPDPGPNPGPGGGTGGGGTGGSTGTTPGGTGGTGGTTGSGGAGSPTSPATTARSSAGSGSVAQNFNALVNANRAAARAREPDTGFSRQLPFETSTSLEGEEPEELGSEDQEVGADEPRVRVGRPAVVDDEADRRTSLSFLAGGLLAFVMLMQVLWIKSEVDRTPDLPAEPPSPPPSPSPSASAAPLPPLRSASNGTAPANGAAPRQGAGGRATVGVRGMAAAGAADAPRRAGRARRPSLPSRDAES